MFDDVGINLVSRKYYREYFLQFGNINECFRHHPEYFEELSSDNVVDHSQTIFENLISHKKRNGSQNYSRISSMRKPYTNLQIISHLISARLKKRSSKL